MEMKWSQIYTVHFDWDDNATAFVFVWRRIGFYTLLGDPPLPPF